MSAVSGVWGWRKIAEWGGLELELGALLTGWLSSRARSSAVIRARCACADQTLSQVNCTV